VPKPDGIPRRPAGCGLDDRQPVDRTDVCDRLEVRLGGPIRVISECHVQRHLGTRDRIVHDRSHGP